MRASLLLILALAAALLQSRGEEPAREAKPRFKGVELYSWREGAASTWRFSLLSGTNRNKTPAEIMAPGHILESVAALKVQLSHLALGEYVSWNSVERNHPVLPPQEVIDEITRTAAALQLNLAKPQP